ncbi:hypothetical protein [Cypionkella sinensis]|uniref:Uncharacterized protein n=1 Tax=Cypionkella sinensis TaxID=1756043 RepID=A0ABV7IZV4_9RHOB
MAVESSRWGWRNLANLIIVAAGLFILSNVPMLGQTQSAALDTLPICKTNLGPGGQWMFGMPGMVYAPVAYDDVKVSGSDLQAWATARNGLGVLIDRAFNAKWPSKSPMAQIEFLRGPEGVVYHCIVNIVPYDPDLEDIEALQVGDCDLKLVAGQPQLMVGHAQVWETPKDSEEFVFGPYQVIDGSTLSQRKIMPIGFAAGVSMIGWFPRNSDGTLLANLCPVRVAPAPGIDGSAQVDEKDLCTASDGKPTRLAVGEVVTLQIEKREGRAFEVDEYALGDPKIVASSGFDKVAQMPILKGIAPGTTSIVLLNNSDDLQARVCEVQVE